jgi:hypothetical protein
MKTIYLLVLTILFSTCVMTTPLTYKFEGTMDRVGEGFFDVKFGDKFTGSFTFESTDAKEGDITGYFQEFEITIYTSNGPISHRGTADAFLNDNDSEQPDIFQIASGSLSNIVPNDIYDMGLVLQQGTEGYHPENYANPINFPGFGSSTIRLRQTAEKDIRGTITKCELAGL